MFAESHAKMPEAHADLSAMVNGAAVLEYGNHLPSFHEPPLGLVVRTTIPDKVDICKSSQNSVVRKDGHRFRIEMEFMLTTGFWLLTTRKTARFCNRLRIPSGRNQLAGLVQANGRRQMIAVLQDGCAVGYSLAIAINRLFSFYLE